MKYKLIVLLCTVVSMLIFLNGLKYFDKFNESKLIYYKSIVLETHHPNITTTMHQLTQSRLESIKKMYFQSWNENITPYKAQFLIDGRDICRVSPPFLLIFVLSMPTNTKERQAIRKTWGSVAVHRNDDFNISAKMVFMLGRMRDGTKLSTSLEEESAQYKDIVQTDFIESRYNLTIKMMHGLGWIKTYCQSAKYILKADDDTFINVARLAWYMRTNSYINQQNIHGFLINAPPVLRDGKYAVSKEEFPSSHYPPYVSGTAYILPSNMISDMIDLAQKLPYCPVDDAYLTGVLRSILDIKLQHSVQFTHMGEMKFNPCEFHLKFAVTNIGPTCMEMLWNLTKQTSKIDCKQSTLYNKNICPIF
ncbi:hypothetical protein ACJMK2_027703 [Sinanodonta woodiana]|uniref:Hexosyltransferase n=1 Tax=Sinanodonta woodiana TaxID=1069815 RepID=A0ABD3X5C7_SINWO